MVLSNQVSPLKSGSSYEDRKKSSVSTGIRRNFHTVENFDIILTPWIDDLEEQSADPIADRFRNTVFQAAKRKQSYFSHCLNERYT